MYKLVRGTVAINIFLGIVIIYFVYQLTVTLNMNVLSNILGNFISVGFFALIVVFQQEIRKFLLLLGSTNYTTRKSFLRYFSFLSQEEEQLVQLDLGLFVNACEKMASDKTGAIIVLERSNNLDFVKSTGDETNIDLSPQILESIFYKNSPLHDGAVIIKEYHYSHPRSASCFRVLFYPYPFWTSPPRSFGYCRKNGCVGRRNLRTTRRNDLHQRRAIQKICNG